MGSNDNSHNISALFLPPLPLVSIPPLPRINNPDIERLVLTHSSHHGLPKAREEINLAEDAAVEDYEKLEHVGDALLGRPPIPEKKWIPLLMIRRHDRHYVT